MFTASPKPAVNPSRAKYPVIAEMLLRRIEQGDYALSRLPSERKLAAELGVSYMTARRAVQQLIESGRLARNAAGRLHVRKQDPDRKHLNIAMVLPTFDSPHYIEWRSILNRVVTARGGVLRPVTYTHEDDPSLLEALDAGFDGLFLLPPPHPSPLLLDRLQQVRHQVVTLWHDLTDLGIPCVDTGRPGLVTRLIDHLADRGHTRVHCLNTQPVIPVITDRIRGWRDGLDARGLDGVLYQEEVPAFGRADVKAYDVMTRLLKSGSFEATALFCTTVGAAVGVNRAAYEHGLRIGRDLALCGFGEISHARLMTPSLTTIATPDPGPYLATGLEWVLTGGREWDRSLKIEPEPEDINLFIGESTTTADS